MAFWLILVGVLAWLAFNWLAPLSLLAFAERMSVGRIPADILYRANAHKVRYYHARLQKGYAFSTWLGPFHAVVLNSDFIRQAYPSQIRFVLAHELGHCALGHLRLRWLCVVTGAVLLPAVKRWLAVKEDEADKYAEQLAGLPRSILSNPFLNELKPSI